AVGTDDGADLALADVEGNIAQGTHAAKGKRHVLDSEQDITWGHGSGAGRYGSWFDVGLHSAASRSGSAVGIGLVFMSTMRTSPSILPFLPSSKVTSMPRWHSLVPA